MPIASGVNRGLRWSLSSAGHGYASGRRAARQMSLIAELIRPGDVMWDVGAHHGYVTLCAARRVGAAGEVHAFEPSASNRQALRRHVGWNRLHNVTVHDCALAAEDGEASFGGRGSSKTMSLGRGEERVQVRRADTLLDRGVIALPTFVKVDVEGAEEEAIAGAAELLRRFRPRLVVEFNPSTARIFHRRTLQGLHGRIAAHGYEMAFIERPSGSLHPTGGYADLMGYVERQGGVGDVLCTPRAG